MLILLLLSIVVPAVLLFLHIIRLRKYKGTDIFKFKKTEMLATLMSFILLIEAAAITLFFRSFFYGGKAIYAAAVSLCAVTLIEAFLLVRCRLYNKSEKPQKMILLNIETICCVLTIICIVYWRLFQWWGF